MNLVTWNLNGLEDENLDMRTEAAMFQILLGAPIEKAMQADFKPSTPDIVVLQEVVSRTFHAHLKPHFQAAGFTLFPQAPSERSYFEVIAVRQPILESNYEKFSYTAQGRGLSTLTIDGLTILTAHLESQKPGASMRIDQAKEILEIMNNHQGAIIFAGDTNLRKSEWEILSQEDTKDVADAWITAGSIKKHKITWRMDKYKARYDRIWHSGITIKSFETIGKEKVTTLNQSPSDHLGIRLIFEINTV
jgi:endonuclease/exonuclease/phosphatase family metal-dependent hydrolase